MGQLVIVEFTGMSKALINGGPRLTVAGFIFIEWLREHTKHGKYIRVRSLQKRTNIYTGCGVVFQR
jgi:hypothetical protein